jgi:hypothetical protein
MANNYPAGRSLQDVIVPGGQLVDLSTASISYAPIPVDGVVVDALSTIAAAITGADCTVTVKAIKSGTTVTLGTITVTQSGSAAGDTDTMTITGSEADRTVKRGDTIVFDSDGASSTTSIANFVAVIRRT